MVSNTKNNYVAKEQKKVEKSERDRKYLALVIKYVIVEKFINSSVINSKEKYISLLKIKY